MDTEELKRLAEAATPGPWSAFISGTTVAIDIGERATGTNPCIVHWLGFDSCDLSQKSKKANAAWIACANPAAILALIAERDALLEALKGYVTAIANAGGGDKDMFIAAIREADNKARAAITKAESK